MNSVEAGRMLAIVATIDPKLPKPDDVGFMRRLWAQLLDDVPADAAERAVRAYYQSERYLTHREPISPADIVQWWNARRRPNERERDGGDRRQRPPFNADLIHAGVRQAVTALAERKALGDGTEPDRARELADVAASLRQRANQIECPHCHAAVGMPCTGPRGRLRKASHHPARLDAAQAKETTR